MSFSCRNGNQFASWDLWDDMTTETEATLTKKTLTQDMFFFFLATFLGITVDAQTPVEIS